MTIYTRVLGTGMMLVALYDYIHQGARYRDDVSSSMTIYTRVLGTGIMLVALWLYTPGC